MEKQTTERSNVNESTGGYEYAVLWNRWLLMPLGVWPLERDAGRSERIKKTNRLAFTALIIPLFLIPQYFYLLTNPGIDACLQILSPEVFFLLAWMKCGILIMKQKKIGYCIQCMREDWASVTSEEDRQIMMKNAKFGRIMTTCSFIYMYPGVVFYNVVWPFLMDNTGSPRNNGTAAETPLPYPTNYIFFDERSTPIYEITWVVQFIGSSYLCFLNCGVYSLTGTLVAHACGQLRIICSRLEDIVDGNPTDICDVKQRLAAIVERHLRVIRYTEHVNESFQVAFLMDEIGPLLIICFLGYLIIHNWNQYHSTLGIVIIGMIVIGNIFNLFIVSFVGQRLLDESQEVGIATARVQWYRLSPKVARSLILCMARSACPLRLSACKMVNMSLENFGDVLKGAFVFLNMVRKVTNI